MNDKPIRSSQSNKSPIHSPRGSAHKLLGQTSLLSKNESLNLLKSFDKSVNAKKSKNLSSHAQHGHSQNVHSNDGSCGHFDKFSNSSADHFMLGEDNLGDLAKDMGIFNFQISADSSKKLQPKNIKKQKTQNSPRSNVTKVPRRKSFDELDVTTRQEPQQPYRKVVFKSNEKSGDYNQYLKEQMGPFMRANSEPELKANQKSVEAEQQQSSQDSILSGTPNSSKSDSKLTGNKRKMDTSTGKIQKSDNQQ